MGFFDQKIDISDVPDNAGSAPLPEGEYLMKAVDYDDQAVSSSGNSMMTVDFAFADSQYESRRTIRDFFVLGNKVALSKLKNWLKASGALPDGTTAVEPQHVQKAMGMTFNAKITQEEYNGYVNNKIGTYLAKGSAAAPQPSASSGDTTQQAAATPSSDNLKKVEWN